VKPYGILGPRVSKRRRGSRVSIPHKPHNQRRTVHVTEQSAGICLRAVGRRFPDDRRAAPVHAEGAFGLNTTATNALGGGAIGAGAGAIIGHQTHHSAGGAAIGGGLGLVAGGLVGHQIQQGEERSAAQQSEIDRQQRELNRLKRQQAQLLQRQQQATPSDGRY
jgi:hypothetical protein